MSLIKKNCIATEYHCPEVTLPVMKSLPALTVVDIEQVRADGRVLIMYLGTQYIIDGSVLEY